MGRRHEGAVRTMLMMPTLLVAPKKTIPTITVYMYANNVLEPMERGRLPQELAEFVGCLLEVSASPSLHCRIGI